jgi:lysophospholipase L1-like esterase
VILDAYTSNLTKIIVLARDRGAEVILVTVGSNLHEFPLRKDGWERALRQVQRQGAEASSWLSHFAEGIRLFQAERFDEALEQFKLARNEDPQSRAPGLLNPRIREGIGCNFFGTEEYCDGVHPNPRTNHLMGEAVARKIIQLREDPLGHLAP